MPNGSGPFGSGLLDPFTEVSVVRRNAVRVTFAFTPAMSDPAVFWDLLRVRNWSLETTGQPRLVQLVQRVNAVTALVFFDGELEYNVDYVFRLSPTIRDILLQPVPFVCPSMPFRMVQETAPQLLRNVGIENKDNRFDVANPFTGPNGVSTYPLDDKGDVSNDTGVEYLKKRVIRRATTVRGQFFHLANYGFMEPLKSTITTSEMVRMRAQAISQIRLEPDVRNVSVSVHSPRPGLVILDIKVESVEGLTVNASVPLSFD